MLESRSAVLKMMQSQACKDRCIDTFPPPFSRQFTPHKQHDFSSAVREVCSSPRQPLSGLKISKAIFLGDVAVGKTSLVNRYVLIDGGSFNIKINVYNMPNLFQVLS